MHNCCAQGLRRNKITEIPRKANKVTKKLKSLFNVGDKGDNHKQANRSKMIKCKKSRKTFHEDILACENVVCSHWLWKKTCLPIK